MPKKVTYQESSAGGFFKPQAGGYPAIIVGVVELGTREVDFKGNGSLKEVNEVSIVFEIEAEQEIYDSDEKKLTGKFEDKIGTITKNYSCVVTDKSNLGKMILAVNEVEKMEDIKNFSLDQLLGQKCYINIEMKGKENNFPTITTVSAPSKKMVFHEQQTKSFYFGMEDINDFIDDFQNELKGIIPSWDIERIEQSPEYADLCKAVGLPAPIKSLSEQEKDLKLENVSQEDVENLFNTPLKEEPTTVQKAREESKKDVFDE